MSLCTLTGMLFYFLAHFYVLTCHNINSEVFGNTATSIVQRSSEDGGTEFHEMTALKRLAMQEATIATQARASA